MTFCYAECIFVFFFCFFTEVILCSRFVQKANCVQVCVYSVSTARGPVCTCICACMWVCARAMWGKRELNVVFRRVVVQWGKEEKKRKKAAALFCLFISGEHQESPPWHGACVPNTPGRHWVIWQRLHQSEGQCVQVHTAHVTRVRARTRAEVFRGRTSLNLFLLRKIRFCSIGHTPVVWHQRQCVFKKTDLIKASTNYDTELIFCGSKLAEKVFSSPQKRRLSAGVKQESAAVTTCQRLDVFSHTHARGKWKSQDYQIVSNTKDINTKISAIHHGCQLVSVATVIYSGAEIHLDWLSPPTSLSSPSVDTVHRNSLPVPANIIYL